MRGAGGPYQVACGDQRGCLLPNTGLFLLFPSRVCPAVSDLRGEGCYPALRGSLGCKGVRRQGLSAATAAYPVPATSSPSQG